MVRWFLLLFVTLLIADFAQLELVIEVGERLPGPEGDLSARVWLGFIVSTALGASLFGLVFGAGSAVMLRRQIPGWSSFSWIAAGSAGFFIGELMGTLLAGPALYLSFALTSIEGEPLGALATGLYVGVRGAAAGVTGGTLQMRTQLRPVSWRWIAVLGSGIAVQEVLTRVAILSDASVTVVGFVSVSGIALVSVATGMEMWWTMRRGERDWQLIES